MTTTTSTFASYNRSIPSSSVNFHVSDGPTLSRQNQNNNFFTDSHPVVSRIGHCLDDMDILSLKRQYANLDLFEQSTLSNSAEDLSQLDRTPYQFDVFGQDQNDLDDDDIPYEEGTNYDYPIAIQERLIKANKELEYDQTPSELKHRQRVSFDTVVKAVDIMEDSHEHNNIDPIVRPCVLPVVEESSTIITSPRSDNSTHEYTVPLNDTQPKQGLSLLEQIKALQFHSTLANGERWATTTDNVNNDSISNQEDDVSVTLLKSNESNIDSQDNSNLTSNSISSKKSMIVAVNGQFDLKDEDDYIAKHHIKSSNNDNKNLFLPTPPIEPKQKQDLPSRPFPIRPKSSSDKKNKIDIIDQQRPKSAGTSKSVEINTHKSSSGVDFNELLRKAAEKKRTELKEERRKKEEAEEKREKELAKAKESYEQWLREKDLERKRINELKRLEREEEKIHQAEEIKRLTELREKKYQQWLERKDNEAMLLNEFRKLQANEETQESSSSIDNINRINNHRAFQKWLRRKYEQSMEEKRQLRLETKRQRRRQRHSIKRNQLQHDLQLAKSFGYS